MSCFTFINYTLVDSCSISTEEKRLMESIEMINNKLRTLPISPNVIILYRVIIIIMH